MGKKWTYDEAMVDALAKHPECTYADWANGIRMDGIGFQTTVVINLWRNEDCFINNDPPRHVVEGYDV
jgi:hypothetical protein